MRVIAGAAPPPRIIGSSSSAESTTTASGALTRVAAPQLSDMGDATTLLRSISMSARYYSGRSSGEVLTFGPDRVTVQEMRDTMADLDAKIRAWGLGERLYQHLRERYVFYSVALPAPGLVTGYYEIVCNGSRSPDSRFKYPLYRIPADLVSGKPYLTRGQIDYEGALKGRGLELVYLESDVDRYFLHVQGSGAIRLPDGSVLRVNYGAANGRQSHLVGREIAKRGLLPKDQISLQTIRTYLREHPAQAPELLSADTSYVFFEERPQGPMGSIGVPVTPLRSIATDSRLFPKGAPVFVQTTIARVDAAQKLSRYDPFNAIVMNQDRGGAIIGNHVDLYVGSGHDAEGVAGMMKQQGTFYYFRLARNGELK
jgi:membrane-bound lytic murein transglycosylase A